MVNDAKESSGFDLASVSQLEFHFDPWGYGFEVWLDGLTFGLQDEQSGFSGIQVLQPSRCDG
jgi:hypothetical protein